MDICLPNHVINGNLSNIIMLGKTINDYISGNEEGSQNCEISLFHLTSDDDKLYDSIYSEVNNFLIFRNYLPNINREMFSMELFSISRQTIENVMECSNYFEAVTFRELLTFLDYSLVRPKISGTSRLIFSLN